jgi:HK97 family phage major capsid protein/HK97 family phage prohead protease
MPTPTSGESRADFLDRCMANPTMVDEAADESQRMAICIQQWERRSDATRAPSTLLRKGGPTVVKEVSETDRTVLHVITSRIVDRDGDVIEPRGMRSGAFTTNPVVLFGHRSWGGPMDVIGRNLSLDPSDTEVVALTQFASPAANPMADHCWHLVKEGMLRAWSIGFLPITWSEEKILPGQTGWWFKEWELVEYSLVPIPSNPEALTRLMKALRLPEGATEGDVAQMLRLRRAPLWDLGAVTTTSTTEGQIMGDDAKTAAEPKPDAATQQLTATMGQLTDMMAKALAQQGEVMKGVTAGLAQVTERIAQLEKLGPPDRTDSDGKDIVLGDRRAPGFIKNGLTTSTPLQITNICRAIIEHDRSFAKEEAEISERFKAAGYIAEYGGGWLFPFSIPHIPSEFRDLRKECAERITLKGVDWGGVARAMRKTPEILRAFGIQQKDLALGDDALGAYLIQATQSDSVIDLLRATSVLARAGATEQSLPPSGNIAYPRWLSDCSFAWYDSDADTAITLSAPTLGAVRLIAKSMRGMSRVPNDFIRFASVNTEAALRASMGAAAALAEDQQFLEGIGSSTKPKGILTYTTSTNRVVQPGKLTRCDATTTATDGDTLIAEDIATIQALYEETKDPAPATAWIMRPRVWAAIRNQRSLVSTDAQAFLFLDQADLAPGAGTTLKGIPVRTTVQLSHNRVKGSGTDLDAILYGNFARVIIGRSGAIEFAASDQVYFTTDKMAIRAILRSDLALEHEESLVLTDFLDKIGQISL